MARDQAMGRIGLVWRRMKFFHADVMLLAVDCFRRNRPNDVEVTLLGAGAAFESKWIRLADLKGNLFSYPETDEQYPTLWSQQRAVLLQLMAQSRSADSVRAGAPGKYGADQAHDRPGGICDPRRRIAHQAVSRNRAAGSRIAGRGPLRRRCRRGTACCARRKILAKCRQSTGIA